MKKTGWSLQILELGLIGIALLGMVARAEIKPDEVLSFNDRRLTFIGWGEAESDHRWSASKRAILNFKMGESNNPIRGEIIMGCSSLGKQKIKATLNGKKIYEGLLTESKDSLKMKFDPKALKLNGSENTLVFDLPDAKLPGNGDSRLLGISLKTILVK